jgi:peptide/nickel transport system ATP-binding protein
VNVVSVENLTKHFPARAGMVRAVDGVSFSIAEGRTLGLVGESGCGKTTLGRTMLRLVEPTAGRIHVAGAEVTELAASELRTFRRHMQIVFQDPYASLNPHMRVGDIVGEPLAIHGLAPSREARKKRVRELLGRVGMRPETADRFPHEFSGGQRQRIGIARALAVEPKLVVLDEPLSALDVSIQAQILNLLSDLQAERKLTYLFISHDLRVIEHISDTVAVMYLGKIVELAPAQQLYKKPRHPYTKALLAAIPQLDPAERKSRVVLEGDLPSPITQPPGCPFHPRCPMAKDERRRSRCAGEIPALREISTGHFSACHFAEEA